MTYTLWTVMLVAQLVVVAQPAAARTASERVEIVLFSDFQCPFCAQFAPPIRELQAKGVEGVQVTVQFKHFPLVIHPQAQLAHQAALAAGEQGQFWEMHDLLFAHPSRAQRDDLLGYAQRLGLDMERFRHDLDSDWIMQRIAADKAEGDQLGVNGTPTFFLNGKAYAGARSFEQLQQLVQGEQRRTQALAEITDNLMTKGPADAPVTLEFFADLQSPVSLPAMEVVQQVLARYPTTVRVQFRNFPLAFHPQAPLAHEAAMIAAREGYFWEFATYALHHQDTLREQDLIAYAGQLGLDTAQFAELLQQHRYAPRVEADVSAGAQRGLRGSPVLFVNGTRMDGVPSLQTLIAHIEAALAAQTATQAERSTP